MTLQSSLPQDYLQVPLITTQAADFFHASVCTATQLHSNQGSNRAATTTAGLVTTDSFVQLGASKEVQTQKSFYTENFFQLPLVEP